MHHEKAEKWDENVPLCAKITMIRILSVRFLILLLKGGFLSGFLEVPLTKKVVNFERGKYGCKSI